MTGWRMRLGRLTVMFLGIPMSNKMCQADVAEQGKGLVQQIATSKYLKSSMGRFCEEARCLDLPRTRDINKRPTLTAFTGQWRQYVADLKHRWLVDAVDTFARGSVEEPEAMYFRMVRFMRHVAEHSDPTCDVSSDLCVSTCVLEERPSIWTGWNTFRWECRVACRVVAEACSFGQASRAAKQAEEHTRWHFENCPPGHYCPVGDNIFSSMICEEGTFRSEWGGSAPDDCHPCPAGYACGAGTSEPVPCPAGFFCQGGGKAIQTCPSGMKCPFGAESPELCPDNTMCPKGSDVPQTCPERHVCDGSATPMLCPRGGYCEKGAPFKPCPPGTYNAAIGQGTPEACVPCPAGYVCGVEGATTFDASPCPAGTFATRSGAKTFASCASCRAGSFCGEASTVGTMKVCPVARYCPKGTAEPIVCPEHTFCAPGSEAPQTCPAGYSCALGTSKPLPCGRGGYCPKGKPFRPCRRGTYGPAVGQGFRDACVPCPAGSVCPSGSSLPRTCPEGSHCRAGAKKAMPCHWSTYCPEGSTNPWEGTLLVFAPLATFAFIFSWLCIWLRRGDGIIAADPSFMPACMDRATYLRLVVFERKRAEGVFLRWLKTTTSWREMCRRRAREKCAKMLLRRCCRRKIRRNRAAAVIRRRCMTHLVMKRRGRLQQIIANMQEVFRVAPSLDFAVPGSPLSRRDSTGSSPASPPRIDVAG